MINIFIANTHFRVGLRLACMILLISFIVLAPASSVEAQRRKSAFGDDKSKTGDKAKTPNKKSAKPSTQPGARPRPDQRKNKEADKFAPQNISLTVKGEGIQLAATWFPPILEDDKKKRSANKNEPNKEDAEPGKSIAPFILVHDWSRSRTDLLMLGKYLQSQGHAVIVPDLRGHGQSLVVTGATKPLDHTKFKKAEKASALGDIDQCKRFLQEKNNEGIVNIDLLNIVAVGDSSHLAIAWALADWTWEPVAGIKQGKDVKSIILFSPTGKFAGSSLRKLVKDPMISGRSTTPLPMLVIWGGQSEAAEGCDSWLKLLRKFRPEAPEGEDLASRWFKQNLFHFQAPTGMKGYELAGNPSAQQIWAFANDFVSQKVVAYKDQFPWQLRGTKEVLKAREQEE